MFGRLQPGQMPNNSQPSQSSSQAQRYRQLLPASSSSSCSSARPLPDPVNYPELQPSSFRPIARRVSTDAPAPSGRHTYPAPHMSRYPSQGRYWVSRPQPERNPTGISGGSAFGQISLLADVAAREADEERGRTRWRSTAEDASVGGPAGAWYQEDERRPSRRDAGGRAAPYPQPAHTQSRMHPSTTRSVRSPSRLRPPEEHPLAGLCLATYPTYDHTDFDADVRRILSTPILAPPVVRDSFTSIPPQWPPHQSQVHGWADPEKGRAWTFSLDPARRRPNHGEQSLSPAKGDVSTSSRPTALDSPRRPPTPLSQPEPPTKKAKTDHPSSVSTSLTSTLQSSPQSTPVGPTKTDRQTRASPQSMTDSGSETGSEVDTSDLSHTSPSSSHLALGNQSGPALEESFNKIVTRAHSSSLSSAASAPVKRTQPLVGSRSTRERAKSENTKPREKKKRRGGPKRKHQNKVAARKHREKKKMLVEQLEQERDTYLSQLRQRDEEIAAIRRELEYANRELERLGGRV